jgi:maltose-binding protein MalE
LALSQKIKEPPALRSLLKTCENDLEIGVFCQQVLTARSWPQINSQAVEEAFSRAIESVISGKLTTETALKQAEDEINLLMGKR